MHVFIVVSFAPMERCIIMFNYVNLYLDINTFTCVIIKAFHIISSLGKSYNCLSSNNVYEEYVQL